MSFGTGSAEGVIDARSTATEANLFVAKGTNALYLNAQATIASDATLTVSGTIDVLYVELGG